MGQRVEKKFFSSEKGMKNRMAVVFLLQPLIKPCVFVDVCKCEKYPEEKGKSDVGKKTVKKENKKIFPSIHAMIISLSPFGARLNWSMMKICTSRKRC
jgi:hypothetical protein